MFAQEEESNENRVDAREPAEPACSQSFHTAQTYFGNPHFLRHAASIKSENLQPNTPLTGRSGPAWQDRRVCVCVQSHSLFQFKVRHLRGAYVTCASGHDLLEKRIISCIVVSGVTLSLTLQMIIIKLTEGAAHRHILPEE